MKMATILDAEREAERFLSRVEDLKDAIARDENTARFWDMTGCPESSAVRRSSMDLTRSLANMRKP